MKAEEVYAKLKKIIELDEGIGKKTEIDDVNVSNKTTYSSEKIVKEIEALKSSQSLEYEGKNITCENTLTSRTLDLVVKGQTYQNLILGKKSSENINYENGVITSVITPTTKSYPAIQFNLLNTKVNQKYTFLCNVIENKNNASLKVGGDDDQHELMYQTELKMGINKIVFTSKSTLTDNISLPIWFTAPANIQQSIKIKDIILLEGDWTNKEVPASITGIESAGEKENKISLISYGKNLANNNVDDWESGGIEGQDGNRFPNPNRIRTKSIFKLPNNNGYLSTKYFGDYQMAIRFYRKNKTFINGIDTPFIGFLKEGKMPIPEGACYYSLACGKKQEGNISVDEIKNCKIQIEIGETSTEYEPYKQDKKEILLPIQDGLKSLPNGTVDTIEQSEDGVYLVRRIQKEAYTDGDENNNEYLTDKVNTYKPLETPVEIKLDIQNLGLEVYKNLTYITTDNAIQPTLSLKVHSNLIDIMQTNTQNINELINENIEFIKNSDLLKETLPNDCVAFWDFAGNKPLVDKLYGHELKVKAGRISYVNKAPFGGGIVLDGTQYLQINADKVGNLDLSQFGEECTIVAWVNGQHKQTGFIAGMWQEDNDDFRRQYGLFTNLPTYGGYRRVCGHISDTGGASPNLPYSRDYSASGRFIPYQKTCMIGMTYDGNKIISYIDGTEDIYINYTEPSAPTGEGKTYNKNPYIFKKGLNKITKANFTVGAVKLTSGMGNFYAGKILGIMIFKRALSKEEMCDLNYKYSIDKVILNFDNVKENIGSDYCWDYGVSVYNVIDNKVYKNTIPDSDKITTHPGFAFTRLENFYNFYVSPSGGIVEKHSSISIAILEGMFPRISQLSKFKFKQHNKGSNNYGCRIAIKMNNKIYVSEERFTSAGGDTAGTDWSTAENKEYIFNTDKLWKEFKEDGTLSSDFVEIPNDRLQGIGFFTDEIPDTFDSTQILRVGYATLYRK